MTVFGAGEPGRALTARRGGGPRPGPGGVTATGGAKRPGEAPPRAVGNVQAEAPPRAVGNVPPRPPRRRHRPGRCDPSCRVRPGAATAPGGAIRPFGFTYHPRWYPALPERGAPSGSWLAPLRAVPAPRGSRRPATRDRNHVRRRVDGGGREPGDWWPCPRRTPNRRPARDPPRPYRPHPARRRRRRGGPDARARVAGAPDTLIFVVAAMTLAGLAGLVGEGTDQLGSRFGPGATGVLQSALGNLPELFISLFALREGLVVLTQTALIGSILGNSLLVLGLAFLAGGLKNGRQVFDAAPVRTIAIVLVLAVAALAIPTVSTAPGGRTRGTRRDLGVRVDRPARGLRGLDPVLARRRSGRVGDRHDRRGRVAAHARDRRPRGCGLGAAVVADWFVEALRPAMATLGLVGGIRRSGGRRAGRATPSRTSSASSRRCATGRDLAISLIQNSSLQVALALTPVLVLASLFVSPVPMTLVLTPTLLVGLALTRDPRRARRVRRRVDLARGPDAARAVPDHRGVGLVRAAAHGLAGLRRPIARPARPAPTRTRTRPPPRGPAGRASRTRSRGASSRSPRPRRARRRSRRSTARGRRGRGPRARGRTAGRAAGASSAGGVPRRANAAITRPVTAGASSASPAATVRTAATSSSAGACLRRNPLAPARRAPNRYSSRSNVVRTTTRGAGPSQRRSGASPRARPCPASGRPSARCPGGASGPPRPPRPVGRLAHDLDVGLGLEDAAAAPSGPSPGRRRGRRGSRAGPAPSRAGDGSRASTRKPPSVVGPASIDPAEHRGALAHADEAEARARRRAPGAPGRVGDDEAQVAAVDRSRHRRPPPGRRGDGRCGWPPRRSDTRRDRARRRARRPRRVDRHRDRPGPARASAPPRGPAARRAREPRRSSAPSPDRSASSIRRRSALAARLADLDPLQRRLGLRGLRVARTRRAAAAWMPIAATSPADRVVELAGELEPQRAARSPAAARPRRPAADARRARRRTRATCRA